MSRPMTNWRPMMRIAWRNAVRTTGSPRRATSRRRNDAGSRISTSDARTSLPGQHEAPGRGIDEQRIRLAQVVRPLADRDLVGDQPVRRFRVRYAQQRLGEAHRARRPPARRGRTAAGRTRCRSCLRARLRAATTSATASRRIAARSAAGSRASASISETTVSSSARKLPLIASPGAEAELAVVGTQEPGCAGCRSCGDSSRATTAVPAPRYVVAEDPVVVEDERRRLLRDR